MAIDHRTEQCDYRFPSYFHICQVRLRQLVNARHMYAFAGFVGCGLVMLAPLALSESGFERNHASTTLAAHVHGEVSLQVSLQGTALDIRLTVPAMDLLGYEQAPHTPAEQARLQSAREFLARPESWLGVDADARCILQGHRLDSPFEVGDHTSKDHHHDSHATCDGDCLLCLVEQTGPACHTGRPNCFYWQLEGDEAVIISEARVTRSTG